jgi:hypothetical protein
MENNGSAPRERTPVTSKPEQVAAHAAVPWQRRHDVDWLRILSLGLLIIFHSFLSFNPIAAGPFPQNDVPLERLVILYGSIYVWRTPLLYLISGIGVRFAMERRDWRQLLGDRTLRILLPLVFGVFVIVPITYSIKFRFDGQPGAYVPDVGHLWFLGNIFLYVFLLLPLLVYLKNRPGNPVFRLLSRLFRWPASLFLLALPLILEATLGRVGSGSPALPGAVDGLWHRLVLRNQLAPCPRIHELDAGCPGLCVSAFQQTVPQSELP